MTVEELEIIVTAKVEEALKEFKKVAPTVQKMVQDVQSAMKNVDANALKKNVNKAIKEIKNKMVSLKKTNKNSKLKIDSNNKEALKKIDQVQKKLKALHKSNYIRKYGNG